MSPRALLLPFFLIAASLCATAQQGGADSQPTRTTRDHAKRVIGYVTQWDAWKATSAGLPKQGFLNHLNLDYSQYTHLNFSFFGVANDGSLHSGDYRNQSIYQAGSTQAPAPLLHGDTYSSWDYHLVWGHLVPQWELNATAQAAGFVAFNGGWKHVASGLSGPLPVPYHPPGSLPGILELAHAKGVKVMASIGGWSMCKHFGDTAADPVKRARFIADCQRLIALGFDGIDFDWEYPGPFAGMNFTGTEADYANFLTLATELRAAIGSGKEITSAMSASPAKLAGFDWAAMAGVLDSINLMTYDFQGGWADIAGHNSPLYAYPGEEGGAASCDTAVQYLKSRGVPPAKIAMGLAFYGRGVLCSGSAALHAPTVKVAKTVQPDGPITTAADFVTWDPYDATPTYEFIRQKKADGWTRHWDDVAKVPYLTKGSSFLSYDDSRSIGLKADYVRQQALGGVIVWHSFGDLRAGPIVNPSDKLPYAPTTDAPLINVVNSVLAGDAIPADGTEGPSPAGGPQRGLTTLPARPIVAGYLNALRNSSGQDQVIADLPAAVQAANLEAFDLIITAFAEPKADGSIGTELGAFSSYLPAVVAEGHALNKSVIVSIGGAYPASLATQFAAIAASPTLRQSFADNVVDFLEEHQLDGVDIDYEFPADNTARANFTLLMQTLHTTVKAADQRYIVMFGGGPGWYMGSFDFAALHPYTDFFFYFGYDWKNPQNGPMRKPGSTQWTQAGDQLPEASVKGGIDYVLGKGFPANKILCGLPFYGSNNVSWSAVRTTWEADRAAYTAAIDADSLEVQINGAWFTTPEAMKRKMDALLKSETSVLTGQASLRGVGCWEIGHEHATHPDLSTAFAEWIAGTPEEPEDPQEPAIDPDSGWVSHAPVGGITLTMQVTDSWGGGFQGQLLLTNNTGAAMSTWSVSFDAAFTVNSMWDGVYGGKTGSTHSMSNPTWGGYSLANGATGTIGFTASGTAAQPGALKLNGQTVGNSGTPYATWATANGAGGALLDSDGDGSANVIEFLFAQTPSSKIPVIPVAEIRSLSVGGNTADYFCVEIEASTTAADAEYRAVASDDLDFSTGRVMVLHGTTDLGGGRLRALWRDAAALNGAKRMGRIEARMK